MSRNVTDAADICAICDCARVPDDDDGHGGAIRREAPGSQCCWVTVRGRRACGACVWNVVLAKMQSDGVFGAPPYRCCCSYPAGPHTLACLNRNPLAEVPGKVGGLHRGYEKEKT